MAKEYMPLFPKREIRETMKAIKISMKNSTTCILTTQATNPATSKPKTLKT
jgi:hypothetical protein